MPEDPGASIQWARRPDYTMHLLTFLGNPAVVERAHAQSLFANKTRLAGAVRERNTALLRRAAESVFMVGSGDRVGRWTKIVQSVERRVASIAKEYSRDIKLLKARTTRAARDEYHQRIQQASPWWHLIRALLWDDMGFEAWDENEALPGDVGAGAAQVEGEVGAGEARDWREEEEYWGMEDDEGWENQDMEGIIYQAHHPHAALPAPAQAQAQAGPGPRAAAHAVNQQHQPAAVPPPPHANPNPNPNNRVLPPRKHPLDHAHDAPPAPGAGPRGPFVPVKLALAAAQPLPPPRAAAPPPPPPTPPAAAYVPPPPPPPAAVADIHYAANPASDDDVIDTCPKCDDPLTPRSSTAHLRACLDGGGAYLGECPICGIAFERMGNGEDGGEREREEHVRECCERGAYTAEEGSPVKGSGEEAGRGEWVVFTCDEATLPRSSDGSRTVLECEICYDDFLPGSKLTRLSCHCVYHEKCVEQWWSRKESRFCPVHRGARRGD